MAQAAGVRWGELDESAQTTVAWATAAELGPHVGSRGLLIGLLRQQPRSAPQALLTHFGVEAVSLFDALRDRVPDVQIDPSPAGPAALRDLPSLTGNAARILDRAAELQRELPKSYVDTLCIFGGLLDTPRATACAALADVLPDVPLDQLRDTYLRFLHGNGMTWGETLDGEFPRATATTKSAPDAPDAPAPDPDQPWPFLAVLQRRVTTADGDELRSAGLGFLISGAALATAAQAAPMASTLLLVNREQGFSPLATVEHIALFELSPPVPLQPVNIVPPLAEAHDGLACFVATVDDHFPNVDIVEGVVRADDGAPGERFVVDLSVPLSDTRMAMGSPVVDAGGRIVGIVGPTATNRSVDAIGTGAIASLREAVLGPATPPAPTGTLSGAGNDAVGEVDQLGFKTYVEAFADLITSPHTQPPLTIGIFGSWGMGKSFLLSHIEREIDRRQQANPKAIPKVHVIRFNAWEYSSMDVVWPALVRTIVSRLDKLSTWPWYRRLFTRVRWNLGRQWRQLWPRLIAGAIAVGVAIAVAIEQDEAGVAAAIVAVVGALGAGGLLKAAKDPVANWVTALFADSDYGHQLQVMKDIRHDLETLEERLHEGGRPDGPVTGRILILIDDLDRCEPGKAVEVLQALNLLLNFNSFVVVLGIDARIVTGAVEKHYEGLLGKAGASGYEYLDKIVQIPFRIPEPGRDDIITFVAGQLGDPKKPDATRETKQSSDGDGPQPAAGATDVPAPATGGAAPGTPGDEAPPAPAVPDPTATPEQILVAAVERMDAAAAAADAPPPPPEVPFTYAEREAFELFADSLRPNPRHLKRLVNVYRLVRALARAQNEPLILERPAATIRWLVMWSQWPYASLAMVERYEELFDEHADKLATAVPVTEPMLHLLGEVEAGLDADIRDRLDDEAAVLRRLLSIPDCGLSWEEIRRIRRFTVNFNPAVEEQLRSTPASPPAPTGSGTA